MAVMRSWSITERWFQWLGPEQMPWEIRKAMMKWCEFHGINPKDVPERSAIYRHPEDYRIVYSLINRDEAGKPRVDPERREFVITTVVEQGEAPPLPWPRVVLDMANRTTQPIPSD
jgi:hypothetical protein